ncbi:CPBP family intramembrane glutamic endopeptidase [Labedella endophytica]|uniref:CPBP family intramembrane metalloprotease n=1 Tax=Labedella endophytica TaxID=1523160 RepID=A0A433JSD5_9MICO|nr:type II CAAX endopeptidase family protein [Labedella endophytica]RUR01221.1 CPBP family intramembrane metalloprotease [Labedella endophytica]
MTSFDPSSSATTLPAQSFSNQAASGPPDATPRLGLGPLGIAVRVVVAIVVLFGANLGVGGLAALVTLIPGGNDVMSETTPLALAVFVGLQVAMLAIVVTLVGLWLRFVERRTLRSAGWTWTRSSALWLLLAVVVAGGLVVAVTALLPSTGPVADADSFGPAPVAFTITALVSQAFLLQGIPEELLFRGWLLSALRRRPVLAVVVTTLSFTIIHLASNGGQQSVADQFLYLALPFGFALLAVGMLLWTRSLWAAVGVHGGFHLGNAAAMVFLPAVDPALSWVVIGATHAVVGLVLVVTALRTGRGIVLDR